MRWAILVFLLGCDEPVHRAYGEVCGETLNNTVTMTKSLERMDKRLSEFTIQPECAACPPSRTCPDDTEALAKGDEALREMEQVKALVKRYRDDGSFGTTDLISQLTDLAGE